MKSIEEQLSDLRCAVVAIVNALGAALPLTPDVRRTLGDLIDAESGLQAGEPD